MMQVHILADDMLYPCKAKRIIGKEFKHRDWVLTGFVHGAGGLPVVTYIVADLPTGAIFGLGETKREALADGRKTISALSASMINEKCEAHQASVDAWHTARAECFRLLAGSRGRKPTTIEKKRQRVFEKSGGRCHYCQTALQLSGQWHVEHYIPKARGGSNHIRNLVAACVDCNTEKRVKTGDEYLEFLGK